MNILKIIPAKVVAPVFMLIVLGTAPVFSQDSDRISLYVDVGSATCDFFGDGSQFVYVFVVHGGDNGFSGSEFMITSEHGFDMAFMEDIWNWYGTSGNSESGISIDYEDCWHGYITVLTLLYYSQNTSSVCSYLEVVPHPSSIIPGEVVAFDCDGQPRSASGGKLMVNPTPACRCLPSSYRTRSSTVSAGGISMGSSIFNSTGTAGQPVPVGLSATAEKKLFTGFWQSLMDTITVGTDITHIPVRHELLRNYPNPFNPQTTIEYRVATRGRVDIVIYNVAGQRVKNLLSETMFPGQYKISWDGINDRGNKVASGVYFIQYRIGNYRSVKKIVLLR